uniref:Uncharacterized protein n=1 Tax=Steinernema glaseri TaxID=37863 RepID=A0A1I7Y8H1_9BILA
MWPFADVHFSDRFASKPVSTSNRKRMCDGVTKIWFAIMQSTVFELSLVACLLRLMPYFRMLTTVQLKVKTMCIA